MTNNPSKKFLAHSEASRVGALIRGARIDQGVSMAELAGLLGVSQSYISRIETGKRPLNASLITAISAIIGLHEESLATANTTAERRDKIAAQHGPELAKALGTIMMIEGTCYEDVERESLILFVNDRRTDPEFVNLLIDSELPLPVTEIATAGLSPTNPTCALRSEIILSWN
ncbi:helix-turn-helix transcriptional regulator [Aeromicrobium sp.]|nr:helix-turn-helix transcriptional regulator [Candidatus Saccharibacteria bacterium]